MQGDELKTLDPTDELRFPHKSLRFWTTTFIFSLVPIMQFRHYRTLTGFAVPVSFGSAGWFAMFLASRKIAELAQAITDPEAKKMLEKINSYLVGSSTLLAAVCAMSSILL